MAHVLYNSISRIKMIKSGLFNDWNDAIYFLLIEGSFYVKMDH